MTIRVRILIIILAFWGFVFSATAGDIYPELEATYDPGLQRDLEACLVNLKLEGEASKGRICLALVDITDPYRPRLAGINEQQMMYAASLPKIAILLGAFDKIEKGQLELSTGTRTLLTRMIRNSSNTAATTMLNKVGKDYLANLLQSPRYQLYDPEEHGGLWVGKDYGKKPAWKRDPLFNLSHGANAIQVARFYYLMETGQLVSPTMSKAMKEIMGDPAIHHKFVKGLEREGGAYRIYRKSGTWRQYHSDSAIVERNGRKYIAVALANSAKGSQWLSGLIVEMDQIISRGARIDGRSE